jgi:hypothetical protein
MYSHNPFPSIEVLPQTTQTSSFCAPREDTQYTAQSRNGTYRRPGLFTEMSEFPRPHLLFYATSPLSRVDAVVFLHALGNLCSQYSVVHHAIVVTMPR